MKKRLLKDLPFGELNKGAVITKGNGGYYIDFGDTYYEYGGVSSNRWEVFGKKECEIINTIWHNSEWFEDATLNHIDIQVHSNKIIFEFNHLDMGQSQLFARGVVHCLNKYYGKGSYSWNIFNNFTMTIH